MGRSLAPLFRDVPWFSDSGWIFQYLRQFSLTLLAHQKWRNEDFPTECFCKNPTNWKYSGSVWEVVHHDRFLKNEVDEHNLNSSTHMTFNFSDSIFFQTPWPCTTSINLTFGLFFLSWPSIFVWFYLWSTLSLLADSIAEQTFSLMIFGFGKAKRLIN